MGCSEECSEALVRRLALQEALLVPSLRLWKVILRYDEVVEMFDINSSCTRSPGMNGQTA